MSPYRQNLHPNDVDTDEENDDTIDPDLRLRSVRTAASTIQESYRDEERVQRRKTKLRQRSLKFFGSKNREKRKPNKEPVAQ